MSIKPNNSNVIMNFSTSKGTSCGNRMISSN